MDLLNGIVSQLVTKGGKIKNLKPEIPENGIPVEEFGEILKKFQLYCKELEDLNNEYLGLISEHKKDESRNNDMYALFRLLSDTMPDLLWAKDMNKRFIFTNKAMCQKLLNASDTNEPIGKTDLFFAKRENESHPENPEWHTFGQLCIDSDEETLKAMKQMQFYEYGNVRENSYILMSIKPLYSAKREN